jgi:hypothetical protein
MEDKNTLRQELKNDESITVMLLKNYLNVQLPSSRNGNTPRLDEVQEPNQKGLGISLNSLLFVRSVSAMAGRHQPFDLTYLYNDLGEPSSWLPHSDLKDHLKTDYGPFNQGISRKDGLIFGLSRPTIERLIGPHGSDSSVLFYHHKIVGGEPRGEFYSFIYNIFGRDMRETLGQLIDLISIGSGTTSQITDECFGALLAGPDYHAKQYRMRKTKISSTLDIGHLLVYEATLVPQAIAMLADSGYDFSLAYDPEIPLADLTRKLYSASQKAQLEKRFAQPRELFDIKCDFIYAENDPSTGADSVINATRRNGLHETQDITAELIRAGIMEVGNYGK